MATFCSQALNYVCSIAAKELGNLYTAKRMVVAFRLTTSGLPFVA